MRSLDVFGGTEIQTLNLAKALIASGYEVALVLYFEVEPQLKSFFEDEGIQLKQLNIDSSKGLGRTFSEITGFLKKEKPDIVHIQYMNPGLIPILAAKWASVPIIIGQIHQPATYYKTLHKLFVKIADKMCDYFMSVSLNTQKSWFQKEFLYQVGQPFERNFTIYNSLYNIFKPNEALLLEKRNAKRIELAVVGRLRWEKGQIFALESFVGVCKKHDNVHLHLVGVGPDEAFLMEKCQELGIADKVTFHGQLAPAKLNEFYNNIHLVIVPSRFEAFGLTAIEAMYFETPIIATNVDGLKEVVREGVDGFLVEFGKNEILTERINLLIENPQMRIDMGIACRKRVEDNFSYEKYNLIIKDFYSRL